MSMEVTLEIVNLARLDTYCSVGQKSYREHYLHLWENEDPTPYIAHSLEKSVVMQELEDPNAAHYLVKVGQEVAGIVKLVKNCGIDELSDDISLKAEKIYLLKAHSGKGLGKKVLQLIKQEALALKKKVIWLDTMQKGNPIQFYQKNGFVVKRESELTLAGAKASEKAMYILTKTL
ncbi:GNAT family N-acetyltransferase [Flagellimonas olearia]|uniref:GNAT family N-acetyltransferase n=2 Tax=Flagellimonas olearia TaxID=552546 RepID=A0A6I1E142_9FLAO|nr:GNAT family N-acetyltransferase [Allomuricauda olearia]